MSLAPSLKLWAVQCGRQIDTLQSTVGNAIKKLAMPWDMGKEARVSVLIKHAVELIYQISLALVTLLLTFKLKSNKEKNVSHAHMFRKLLIEISLTI